MASPNKPVVRARDVMSKSLATISGMATAKEAADRMRAERVSALIVEKRHEDDAWGLIAVQDLIKGVIIPGRAFGDVHVYEIMTKPVITVPAEMDIRYVARLLHRAGIRRAPVEENRSLIGMIALRSLILDHDIF
jgi:signal-transduction protein with cAMP-binding, CBS, and nucleotidyltransferase domain